MTKTGVTHTNTATGDGGGKLTQDPDPKAKPDQNSKNDDFKTPAGLHGQDPEDVAERMGSTGKDTGNA